LEALQAALPAVLDPNGAEVKALLRAHTDEAIAQGVFGTPSFEVDGKLFWGLDALPMLRDYLDGNPWFEGTGWTAAAERPSALKSA
jgi:2-hydroxychromene-2-carboxylate isomerase